MKSWILPSLVACVLPACISTGDFKHGGATPAGVHQADPHFVAGQFVRTKEVNAAFFKQLPLGEMMPDMLLPKQTPMRIIQPSEGYSKVELDNGVIGHVLTDALEALPAVENPQPPANDPKPEVPVAPPLPPSIPPRLDPGSAPLPPGL